jgi:hypothetical protein
MIQERYEVQLVTMRTYGIRDMRLNDWCSLGDGRVLRWETQGKAQRWLDRCYRLWEFTPLVGDDPTPVALWGRPGRRVGSDTSPWADFTTPVNDSRFGA